MGGERSVWTGDEFERTIFNNSAVKPEELGKLNEVGKPATVQFNLRFGNKKNFFFLFHRRSQVTKRKWKTKQFIDFRLFPKAFSFLCCSTKKKFFFSFAFSRSNLKWENFPNSKVINGWSKKGDRRGGGARKNKRKNLRPTKVINFDFPFLSSSFHLFWARGSWFFLPHPYPPFPSPRAAINAYKPFNVITHR